MKGQILVFSFQTNYGVIMGVNGNRYSFTGASWQGDDGPQQGMRVDFDTDGSAANGIYPEPKVYKSSGGPTSGGISAWASRSRRGG